MKLEVYKKRALAGALALLSAAVFSSVSARPLPNVALPSPDKATLDYGLKATGLGNGWYVIAGQNADFTVDNGCNIINTGFYVAADKVWVINTGTSRLYGEQQRKLIDSISNGKPIAEVVALNLHPDYFMGNQAFPAQSLAATKKTTAGINAEGPSYEDNLYRLCGDWMKGTEMVAPVRELQAGDITNWGGRKLQAMELKGHTASDLIIFDPETRVLWAGGLVFHERIVTTPHADLPAWLESLQTIKKLNPKVIIPSHGPVAWGPAAIDQTIDYVSWLEKHLREAAEQGLTMNELLEMGVPKRFQGFAAYPAEFLRNVTHLYPRYEKAALGGF